MLEVRHLSLRRGGRQILDSVSLALAPGEVTAICGPNGAGKSTLLRALAALEREAGAAVLLDGRQLADYPPRQRARRIGYLPQDGTVAWDMSVATLARIGRLPWGTSAEEDGAIVDEALAALDLSQFADRSVRSLSGGERARALLARVLAGQPCWLLADEPLAALDLAHQLALLGHFRKIAGQGVGVVLVLHDLALAMNHADRVVVLNQARAFADGPPENALSAQAVETVWGVPVRWLGAPGARALVAG